MEKVTASKWESRWRTLRNLEADFQITEFAPIYKRIIHADIAKHFGFNPDKQTTSDIKTVMQSDLHQFLMDETWLRDIASGSYADTFEDVYHAALFWRLWCEPIRGKTPEDRGRNWVHRGENKNFPDTSASIQRLTAAEHTKAISELEQFVDVAERDYYWLDEKQAVAVAQHYGGEGSVNLQTGLLDITWDPYVALFFASYKWAPAKAGDEPWKSIGRVSSFKVDELERLVAFNYLAWTTTPGFSRLPNQRALFFDAPDPSILDDYAPYRVTFHQEPGLVFTDSLMNISEEHLLGEASEHGIDRWRTNARPIPEIRIREALDDPQNRKPFIAQIVKGLSGRNPQFHELRDNPDRDRIITLISKMYLLMREDERIERTSLHWLSAMLDSCISRLRNNEAIDILNAASEFTLKCRDSDRPYIREHITWANKMWNRRNIPQLLWHMELNW